MSSQVPIIKMRHNYRENIWLLHIIQLQNHSILTLLLFSRSKKHRLVKNSGWNQVACIEGQFQPHPCGWHCQWPSPDFFHINQTLTLFRYQRCMDLGSTGHSPHTHQLWGLYFPLPVIALGMAIQHNSGHWDEGKDCREVSENFFSLLKRGTVKEGSLFQP